MSTGLVGMKTYFYSFVLGENEVLGITDPAATNTKGAREVWAGCF